MLLFDIELDSATQHVATKDFYYGGVKYLGCVIPQSFNINRQQPNLFYGISPPAEFSFSIAATDDGINTPLVELFDTKEFRGRWVKAQRYTEEDGLTFIGYGRINSVSFGSIIEISTSSRDMSLEKLLPSATITTDEFDGTALDLGKPINICFGHCRNVPLYNIRWDVANDIYDWLIGYGNIEGVYESESDNFGVHRNDVLCATALAQKGYAIYTGSSWIRGSGGADEAEVYGGGYAFIRFFNDQTDWGGVDTYTADIKGLVLGGGSANRNFATCLYNLLTDSTWGLGDSADSTSFTTAATTLANGNGYYCDGAIVSQENAQGIIDDMLMSMRSFVYRNDSKEWEITVCAAGSSVGTFGFNDGQYNNIVDCGPLVTIPADEIVSNITVHYDLGLDRAYSTTDDKDRKHFAEITHEIDADFGVDQVFELRFVREDDTAEKFVSWMTNNMIYSNTTMKLRLDMSGRNIALNDIITLEIPSRNISSDWLVSGITYNYTDQYSVTVRPYSASIFGDVVLTPSTPWSGTGITVSGPLTITSNATVGDGVKHPGQLTLQIAEGYGDTYIAAGKTDFTVTDNGFILGLDDSDSNYAKFYLGNATEYFTWNGSKLVFTGTNSVIGNLNLGDGVGQVGRLTLQVAPTYGDTYIRAGKTDFTNAETGFIIGIDDSDSDRTKFYVGDSTNYINWTGTGLVIETAGLSIDTDAGTFTWAGDLDIGSVPGFPQDNYCFLDVHFTEGYGLIVHDGSYNHATGTGSGITWTGGGPLGGKSCRFQSASSSTVDFGTNTTWNIPTTANKDMAWSFWFYQTTPPSSTADYIMEKLNSTPSGWVIFLNHTTGYPALSVYDSGGSGNTHTIAHDICDGEWHHVCFVYEHGTSDDSVVTGYINGVQVGTPTTNIKTMGDAGTDKLWIGALNGSSGYLDGYLQGFKLYARITLAANNVQALYKFPQGSRGGQLTARSVFVGTPSGSLPAVKIDDTGLWMYGSTGANLFGFAISDGNSWASSTLNKGDFKLGDSTNYILYDASAPSLAITLNNAASIFTVTAGYINITASQGLRCNSGSISINGGTLSIQSGSLNISGGTHAWSAGSITISATASLTITSTASLAINTTAGITLGSQATLNYSGNYVYLQPDSGTRLYLGQSGDRWGDLYLYGTALTIDGSSTIDIIAGTGYVYVRQTYTDIGISGNLRYSFYDTYFHPIGTAATIDLGGSSNYWKNAYVNVYYQKDSSGGSAHVTDFDHYDDLEIVDNYGKNKLKEPWQVLPFECTNIEEIADENGISIDDVYEREDLQKQIFYNPLAVAIFGICATRELYQEVKRLRMKLEKEFIYGHHSDSIC